MEATSDGTARWRTKSIVDAPVHEAAMRLVRFDTGRALEARLARRTGWKASTTGSRPVRRAIRTYRGVSSTTAASRLRVVVTRAASTHNRPLPPPRRVVRSARRAKKPRRSSSTARGTAASRKATGPTSGRRAWRAIEGENPPAVNTVPAARTGTSQAGSRQGRSVAPATPAAKRRILNAVTAV